MKTIKDWFLSVKSKQIRSKLLKNIAPDQIVHNSIKMSLSRAISGGFLWEDTEEGFNYWSDINAKAKAGRISLS